MFWLLVKVRIAGLWNGTCRASGRSRLVTAGLTLLSVALFAAVYGGFVRFLALSQGARATEELVYEIFYFLFLFLLAGAVPFVASTLLHSQDYLLLAAAPVRPYAIVSAKLLDATITNSLQFAVIGLPAIFACSAALKMPAWMWPSLIVILALFVLLPALLTAAALLVALKTLGAKRVRAAIASVNLLMAAVVCLTIVMQVNRLPIRHDWPSGVSAPHLPVIAPTSYEEPSGAARTSPSAWFASALIDLAGGRVLVGSATLAGGAAAIALLFGACVALGKSVLDAAASSEQDAGLRGAMRPSAPRASRAGRWRPAGGPMVALIAKDLRYVARDSVLLGQLSMPLILFFVPYALAIQRAMRATASTSELYIVAVGMTAFIVFMQTSILALSSIGLENRGFWMVLTSPVCGGTVLWAKFAMSTIVSGGTGVALTVLNGVVFRAGADVVLLQCLVVSLVAAALCGIGVGISAALPRFVYENPAHRVSPWAMILGFFATAGYVMTTTVLFASMYFLSLQVAELAGTIYLVGATAFLLLTTGSVLFPMVVGVRRLDRYQWVH